MDNSNIFNSNQEVKNKMRKGEYQDNLRADYKRTNYESNPKNFKESKGKNLGKVVMDENENLDVITSTEKEY